MDTVGTLMIKELDVGEKIVVDTHSLVAWSDSVTLDIRKAGGVGTCCCGGEGLFNTLLIGPGVVYVQSMSFKRFKASLQLAVAANANGNKNQAPGELTSMLGGGPESEAMAR